MQIVEQPYTINGIEHADETIHQQQGENRNTIPGESNSCKMQNDQRAQGRTNNQSKIQRWHICITHTQQDKEDECTNKVSTDGVCTCANDSERPNYSRRTAHTS